MLHALYTSPPPRPFSLREVFVSRNYFWLGSTEREVIISTTVKRLFFFFFFVKKSKRESFSAFDQMSRAISLRAVFKRLVHSIAHNCTDGFSHHLCKNVYCVNVRSEISFSFFFFCQQSTGLMKEGKQSVGFGSSIRLQNWSPLSVLRTLPPTFLTSVITGAENTKTERRLLLLCKCKES